MKDTYYTYLFFCFKVILDQIREIELFIDVWENQGIRG